MDRSALDLFHLRDGFEIEVNFDRNVSCFIFVNALMHDDAAIIASIPGLQIGP